MTQEAAHAPRRTGGEPARAGAPAPPPGAASPLDDRLQALDFLDGGAGDDFLEVFGDGARALGGEGNDTLIASAGRSTLEGGAGDDLFRSGAVFGTDTLMIGGDGFDVIDFSTIRFFSTFVAPTALTREGEGFRLTGFDAAANLSFDYRFESVERLDFLDRTLLIADLDPRPGGAGPDTINGSPFADALRGKAGDDLLRGREGDDRILGGAGRDTLNGGAGADTLRGGAGDDLLLGGEQADRLVGGAGDDTLEGGGGRDTLLGGGGNDLLVSGRGPGRDEMSGGRGDDTLVSSLGRDVMTGGPGRDRFVIEAEEGFRRITDFAPGRDVILIPESRANAVLETFEREGFVGVVIFGGATVELEGLTADDISAADFIFF